MKKLILITILAASFFNSHNVLAAMDHGSNGNKGRNNAACKSQGVVHMKPKHLEEVLAGSEFSFWVKGVKNPSEVKVTVKNIPVTMTAEDKDTFFLFKGKLPKTLIGTAARIKVEVLSRKCPSEKGWLVKISE